jgi:hypothetical protein
MITDTFDDLSKDLQSIKHLMETYGRCKPASVQWLVFVLFKTQDVQTLQKQFSKYRSIYSSAFAHAAAVADARNAEQLDKIAARNKELNANLAAVKKQQQEADKAHKESNAKVDKILKLVEKMVLDAPPNAPTNSGNGRLVDRAKLESELLESGLKKEEVKKIMGLLALDSSHVVPPTTISDKSKKDDPRQHGPGLHRNKSQGDLGKPDGLKVPMKGRGRSASPLRKAKADKSPSPGPAKSKWTPPSPSPSPLKAQIALTANKPAKARNEHTWILCVDCTNGCMCPINPSPLPMLIHV